MRSDAVLSDGLITVTIDCHSNPGEFHFAVPGEIMIRDFLALILEKLAEGENGTRVKNMQSYYEPILELCAGDTTLPLDSDLSLLDAGVKDKAVCKISAKPLKERIMFCNNG